MFVKSVTGAVSSFDDELEESVGVTGVGVGEGVIVDEGNCSSEGMVD